jgi:putative spermidine/putrescine transport system permease protein
MADSTQASGPILTADGQPLKVSLERSMRQNKLKAIGLVSVPLLFLVLMFIVPILMLLVRSADDRLVNDVFPETFDAFASWDQTEVPGEELFAAMATDLKTSHRFQIGKASSRMNYAKSGWRSLIKKTSRGLKKIETGPYKEALIKLDKRWGDVETWKSLSIMQSNWTYEYYLNSIDLKQNSDLEIVQQPENRRVYKMFWWRTFEVSVLVTIFCLILAYPVAHLLATLPLKLSNLLMICVLMPFWTSLLVRIVAWMVMLQQKGVVNSTLVALHIVSDDNRLEMMYNYTGTLIVMTQILLPFMILPLYSVMKTIPPSYMRAAQNLGAPPSLAFIKVYMPQTLPGIGAGCILVFIVAVGYFITPELVGGKDGQLIGNQINYHMRSSLNWGLACGMGAILLVGILLLYWVYDKIVGIDNMKMG